MASSNNDIKNKIELNKEYSDARVSNVMDDSNSLSVKIDAWNLKLEQLRAEFETKLSTSSESQLSNAYSTSAEIVQLQQVIEQLHADIEALKEVASRTRTSAQSRDAEISQLRADMVYQQELDDVREHIDSVCSGVISGAHSSEYTNTVCCTCFIVRLLKYRHVHVHAITNAMSSSKTPLNCFRWL